MGAWREVKDGAQFDLGFEMVRDNSAAFDMEVCCTGSKPHQLPTAWRD
jgi:hypothetical protein